MKLTFEVILSTDEEDYALAIRDAILSRFEEDQFSIVYKKSEFDVVLREF